MNDLETFIHSIHPSRSKVAAPSARELAMLHGAPSETLDAVEKLAYYAACFLDEFEGTPLYDQAIALQEQELKLEAKEIADRERRRAQEEPASDTWAKRDQLRLEKDALSLELHKLRAAGKVGPSNKDGAKFPPHAETAVMKTSAHIPMPPDKAKAFLEAAAARAAKPTGKPAVSAGLKSTKFNRLTEPFKSAAEKFAALNLKVLAKAGKPDAWRSASQYAAHQATTPGATKLVTDHLNKPAPAFSRNVSDYLSKTSAETPDTWDEKKQGRIGQVALGTYGTLLGGASGVLAHQIGTHKERVRLGRAHLQDISNQTSVKKRLSGTAGKPKHTKVLASIEKKLNRGDTRAGIAGAAALGLAGAVGGKRLGEHAARKQKEHDLKLHRAVQASG